MVDDPEAEMPVDWDEEEDGEWEAPKIGVHMAYHLFSLTVCVA